MCSTRCCVDAVAEKSKELNNTLFISQKTKDAIVDKISSESGGLRPNVELRSPDVIVNVHIAESIGTVSLDTSGEPLFHRGYRTACGEAPLHETLAAAILLFANFDENAKRFLEKEERHSNSSQTHPLVVCDPFCGSGTFLTEAAMIMTNTPSGYKRKKWGFFHLPEFSSKDWEEVKRRENERIIPLKENVLFGADQSEGICSFFSLQRIILFI
jgi:putative N6-adenine-specific DNA methylase